MLSRIPLLTRNNDIITDITVKHICNLIRKDVNHPAIKQIANDARQVTIFDTALSIFNLMQDKFKFRDDPPQIELLRNPAYHAMNILMYGETSADCDENCALVSSLLYNCGIQPKLFVVSKNSSKKFEHIFAGFSSPFFTGGYCAVDPQENFLGEFPPFRRIKIYSI